MDKMTKPNEEDRKKKWKITIQDYGSFTFEGTEEEAREKMCEKAEWEGSAGKVERVYEEGIEKTAPIEPRHREAAEARRDAIIMLSVRDAYAQALAYQEATLIAEGHLALDYKGKSICGENGDSLWVPREEYDGCFEQLQNVLTAVQKAHVDTTRELGEMEIERDEARRCAESWRDSHRDPGPGNLLPWET